MLSPVKYILRKYKAVFSKTATEKCIIYYPKMNNIFDINNHYFRAAWYFPYLKDRCEQVIIKSSLKNQEPVRPEYMMQLNGDLSHIDLLSINLFQYLRLLKKAKVIVVWKNYNSRIFKLLNKIFKFSGSIINVDTNDLRSIEYGEYCGLYWRYILTDADKKEIISESRNKFINYSKNRRLFQYKKAYVFGTGPSLNKANQFDFSNSLSVVCNSIVQNDSLMDHINPDFICAGDVVSHLGVSKYAEVFRQDLFMQIEKRDLLFVTTATFGFLLYLHFPQYKHRVVLVEQTVQGTNFNLIENFGFPMLDSTLNIHMIPIAATFVDEIYLLGVDGKIPAADNEDFWAHAKDSQYDDLVGTGHLCHPTFDVNRQKNTYDRFIKSVEQTVTEGEQEGKYIYTLNKSYIPALAGRQNK